MSNEMIPQYGTKLLCDIYGNVDDFIKDFNDIGKLGSSTTPIAETTAKTVFYLLYAKFGNNPIANNDEQLWKFKLFSVIWQYGPTWEKRLDIQKKLRTMSDEDLMAGSKQIYNHAMNPATDPTTADLDELDYINDQNTANYKRGKLEAYATLWDILKIDVTNDFINKFTVCFKKFVAPAKTWIYVTGGEN